MKLSKKKTLKILAYCATAAVFLGSTNVVSAEVEHDESGNSDTITAGDYDKIKDSSGWINGGVSENGEASKNNLDVSNLNINGAYINGGYILGRTGNADRNIVTIRNVHGISFFHGGYAPSSNGSASYNTLNIYNSSITHIHAGHIGSGVANYNTVNFFSGSVSDFTGAGYAGSGEANYNTLNILNDDSGTTLNGKIQGGYVIGNGNAIGNEVNIFGGTFNHSGGDNNGIYGGYVGGSGNASGNSVNISGGKFTGNIYGGYVGTSGSVTDNTINISGNPDLSSASLIAAGGNFSNSTGNKVNIFTKNIFAKNVSGFDSLNFYITPNISGGDTMLTLTNGATDLTSTTMNFYAIGGANLVPGSQINLLANSNGINISNLTNDGILAQGISLDYGVSLGLNDDGTAFTATIGQPGNLKPQTNILSSAALDSAGLLDSGTDRLAEWLPPEGLVGESIPTTQFNPFAGISGSVFKIKTSDGQKLKSKNAGLDVGMARFIQNRHGLLVFGPITDYGSDSYESRLTHAKSEGSSEMYTTEGSGTSQYFAAGIIARQMNTDIFGNPDGMYYEGSLRGGQVQTNFASDNFLVHGVTTHASYSASTPCFAGHVRIGWAGNIGGSSRLDAYGIYSLNRVNGFTTTLSTGEEYRFSAVNSGRLRIGARLTRDYKGVHTFYSGLAYIHEFTGETHGEYLDRSTTKAGLKGSSGLIELGWRFKQNALSDTMFDASMTGWVGHQKGFTFSAKFKRDF